MLSGLPEAPAFTRWYSIHMSENQKIKAALSNTRKAFSKLDLFLSKPIEDDRDKAGVIQAFEFTFEIFWKTFQKIALSQGIIVHSPRESIKAAFQMHFIETSEEQVWLDMMRDRSLTSHTYKEDLSTEIFQNIKNRYFPSLKATLARMEN